MTKKQDDLTNHNYDGIQEYDNDLPRWWVYLFIITIIWSGVYAYYFHYMTPPTEERIAAEMAALKKLQQPAAGAPVVSEADITTKILALTSDTATLGLAAGIYAARCAACHAAEGQGLIGPNLTDDNWIHGGSITQIRNTIVEGVPSKGMLSWKGILKPEEIDAVTAYVWNLRGKTGPNPKAPQGEIFNR